MRTSKRKAIERHQSAPTINTPKINTPKLPPTLEQIRQRIRQRIHEIYLARGGAAGRELDDWLQAERELMAARIHLPQYKTICCIS